jgi:hypothetical protein
MLSKYIERGSVGRDVILFPSSRSVETDDGIAGTVDNRLKDRSSRCSEDSRTRLGTEENLLDAAQICVASIRV